MRSIIRVFLLLETLAFVTAALTHFGILFPGYAHQKAAMAETVIGLALLLGLAVSMIRPALTVAAGLLAQSFALLGTLVGIFTIIIGVGPRTAPDIVYHAVIVLVLAAGVALIGRSHPELTSRAKHG